MSFQLRTEGDPLLLAASVPTAVQRIDPHAFVSFLSTLDGFIDVTLVQYFYMIAQFAGFFSGLALILLPASRALLGYRVKALLVGATHPGDRRADGPGRQPVEYRGDDRGPRA